MAFPTVLGIDEAGRGPVLGPLCLAAVVLDPPAARALKRMGVRDSKAFGTGPDARRARALLAREVVRRARFVAEHVVDPEAIDARCLRGELNILEREVAEAMVGRALDHARACGRRAEELRIVFDGRLVFGELADRLPNAIAVDGAEEGWVAVAAASVVAKRRRDALFGLFARRIRRDLGLAPGEPPDPHEGGGYINDATRRLFERYAERHRRLPPGTRRSWRWAFLYELCARLGLPEGELLERPAPVPRRVRPEQGRLLVD